jgi:hypothetical protein
LSIKPIKIRAEARDEFLREIRFYDTQRPGTGKRFRETVRNAFTIIQHFPESGAPGPANTRRAKVKGFPFTVVYRNEAVQIVVFAISPDRQQPGYWLVRVTENP